jgi:PAS domain S-box-containing protein
MKLRGLDKLQGLDELQGWKRDAQDFIASVLECVAQPVLVVDQDGVAMFANPAALATLGYGALAELKGKPSHETIHYKRPDGTHYPASECPLLRPRMTGETIRMEEDWFFRKDGAMFPVSYTSAPIELPSGRGAVVAFSDIAERRRVEQALRESDVVEARNAELQASEQRFRAMLESAFDAIVSTDREGHVTYLNAAAQRMFGHTPEQALGLGFVELIVPSHRRGERLRWWFEQLRGDREVLAHEVETTAVDARGREFPVEISITRMSLPGSTGYTAYYRDISERRRAELDLRQARRRVIEAADLERRRIARDLHDGAQQQLVNVALNLELAVQQLRTDPEKAHQCIELAQEETHAGTTALRELVAGIHPAILTHRGLAAAVDSLAGRLPLPVELVELDSARLTGAIEVGAYFVICEALTNVVKHAQASKATVRTVVSAGQLLVTVTDDGKGGADANGSGLTGLADRVAALDGALQVASHQGQGTTVSCRIPIAQKAGEPGLGAGT